MFSHTFSGWLSFTTDLALSGFEVELRPSTVFVETIECKSEEEDFL